MSKAAARFGGTAAEAAVFEHRGLPRALRHPPRPAEALPLELAAFQDLVDPALLENTARRAQALGVGGDEVLRCHKIVPPDTMTVVLAEQLGLEVDPLDDNAPPRSARLLKTACSGVLARADSDGRTKLTLAPRGLGLRRLARALADDPKLASRLKLASPERLSRYVRSVGAKELAREAVLGLHRRSPDLSAMAHGRHRLRWFSIAFAAAVLMAALLAPGKLLIAVQCFLAFSFLAWTGLRLRACCMKPVPAARLQVPERMLPIYTLIVPLYREAKVVPRLVAALKKIRYPPEKLDIKLLLEADDVETVAAVEQLALHAPFEVIFAPPAGPRTKPKALAAALPFARGSFAAVYDAEDEPEPDQLRDALAAFAAGPPELACVQARLAVDNVRDSWFSRQFAAEYAGQFDVFLPALAHLKLPLPLGGTSNHFRTEILRKAGGWDPFNVTEDADLGMRLARYGYRCGVISSTTWEEAPVDSKQWLGQRTRWFKGWLQTWVVHMRAPGRLWRELGTRGFAAFQLLVGGTVLAALVHPFFLAFVLSDAVNGTFFTAAETAEQSFRKWLALATLGAGYLGSILLGFAGLRRRNMLGSAWVLATIPIYWLLLSAAAWRAMWQLLAAPQLWEKTEHGRARSSLRAERNPARPAVRPPVRDNAAGRRRLRRQYVAN